MHSNRFPKENSKNIHAVSVKALATLLLAPELIVCLIYSEDSV